MAYPLTLNAPAGSTGGIHARNTSPSMVPPPLVRGGCQNMTHSDGPEHDSISRLRPVRTPTPLIGATRKLRAVLHGAGGEICRCGSGLICPSAVIWLWQTMCGASASWTRAPAPATRRAANTTTAMPRTRWWSAQTVHDAALRNRRDRREGKDQMSPAMPKHRVDAKPRTNGPVRSTERRIRPAMTDHFPLRLAAAGQRQPLRERAYGALACRAAGRAYRLRWTDASSRTGVPVVEPGEPGSRCSGRRTSAPPRFTGEAFQQWDNLEP